MMKIKMIILTILSTMLVGCRTHEYCKYKTIYRKMLGGQLTLGIFSNHTSKYEEEGEKITRYGFPYIFEVGFTVDLFREHVKSEFVLVSLKAKGVESGKELIFPGGKESFVRVRLPSKEETQQSGFSSFEFTISKNMGVTYEPFDIEAEIRIILADGTEQSEHIKVRLEKDYKKKRQSDTWDYLRSM